MRICLFFGNFYDKLMFDINYMDYTMSVLLKIIKCLNNINDFHENYDEYLKLKNLNLKRKIHLNILYRKNI